MLAIGTSPELLYTAPERCRESLGEGNLSEDGEGGMHRTNASAEEAGLPEVATASLTGQLALTDVKGSIQK